MAQEFVSLTTISYDAQCSSTIHHLNVAIQPYHFVNRYVTTPLTAEVLRVDTACATFQIFFCRPEGRQTVDRKSLPWRPSQRRLAGELRSALIVFMIERAQQMTPMNQERQRRNTESISTFSSC